MSIAAMTTPPAAASRTATTAPTSDAQEPRAEPTQARPSAARLALGTAAFAGGTALAGLAVDKLWGTAGYAKGSGLQYIGLLAIPAGAAYIASVGRNNSDAMSTIGGGLTGMGGGLAIAYKTGNSSYSSLMMLMSMPAAQIGTMAAEKLAGVPNQNPPVPRDSRS